MRDDPDAIDEMSEGSDSTDLRSLYLGLTEKAWLIALCVVAAGFVTFGYLKKAPRVFAG